MKERRAIRAIVAQNGLWERRLVRILIKYFPVIAEYKSDSMIRDRFELDNTLVSDN